MPPRCCLPLVADAVTQGTRSRCQARFGDGPSAARCCVLVHAVAIALACPQRAVRFYISAAAACAAAGPAAGACRGGPLCGDRRAGEAVAR